MADRSRRRVDQLKRYYSEAAEPVRAKTLSSQTKSKHQLMLSQTIRMTSWQIHRDSLSDCAIKDIAMSESFDESWSSSIQSFIQRSPPGHMPDVMAACRLLVAPAKLPKDLVWRACAAHNEKNLLIVRPPQSAMEGAPSRSLLVAHEGCRAGSRAQQQVPYKDGSTDQLFAIDHEKQES
eukprot:g24773.t1